MQQMVGSDDGKPMAWKGGCIGPFVLGLHCWCYGRLGDEGAVLGVTVGTEY